MLPIDPAELSGYLDGELPAGRAEEIRAALARDPALREVYEQLVACDADWSAQAATAKFRPRVHLDQVPFAGRFETAALVLGLFLLRIGFKVLPPFYGAGLEAILLVFGIGWGLLRILQATDADRRRYALATDG